MTIPNYFRLEVRKALDYTKLYNIWIKTERIIDKLNTGNTTINKDDAKIISTFFSYKLYSNNFLLNEAILNKLTSKSHEQWGFYHAWLSIAILDCKHQM